MRKSIKILLVIGAVSLLSAFGSLNTFAGSWQQSTDGWRYKNDDGSYPISTWESIDDEWYRFGENGYMVTGFYTIDGTQYFFDETGALIRQNFVSDGQWYEVDADGTILNAASRYSYRLEDSLGNRIPLMDNSNTDEISQVMVLVNQERNRAGTDSLKLNEELSAAAQKRAEEIAESFGHIRPDGSSCFSVLVDAGLTYTSCGENVASGQISANHVMKDWMNSPGHKNNILRSSFDEIGVGYYSVDGVNYWAQLFTGN